MKICVWNLINRNPCRDLHWLGNKFRLLLRLQKKMIKKSASEQSLYLHCNLRPMWHYVCRSKLWDQEFRCILSDEEIWLDQSENESLVLEESVQICKFGGYIIFFNIHLDKRLEDIWIFVSTWITIQHGAKTLTIHLVILRVPISQSWSVEWRTHFYFAAFSIFFLKFETRQWQSRDDRVLNLKIPVRLPLFWSTWSRAIAGLWRG